MSDFPVTSEVAFDAALLAADPMPDAAWPAPDSIFPVVDGLSFVD